MAQETAGTAEGVLFPRRAYLIVNPASGGYARGALEQALEQALDGSAWDCRIYEMQNDGNVAEQVRQAVREGYRLVVAAGGDGTIAAVAAGLVHSGVPLGIIPLGTGNVLARELRIPLEPVEALRLLLGTHALKSVDALQVSGQLYLLNVSVGLTALAIEGTPHHEKRRFGRIAYVWNGLRRMVGLQPRRFSIAIDGQSHQATASDVAVVNAAVLGDPAFRWNAQARLDDGEFQVCVIRARSLWHYLRVAGDMLLRRQHRDPYLNCYMAHEQVTIAATEALPVQADGEVIGRTPVEVRLIPRAIDVVVPRG